jgi:hypothetical protein
MVGDYISTSIANGKAFPVFAIASQPVAHNAYDEAIAKIAGGLALGG